MNKNNNKYALKIKEKLQQQRIRTEIDDSDNKIGKKVRDAQLEKVFYMLTLGDKEQKSKTLAVRTRQGKLDFGIKLEDFIERVKEEVGKRV